MKEFTNLVEETLNVTDLDELEAAADLFQYGLENGHYNKRQVKEFNTVYWKTKDKLLAFECVGDTKVNILDVISIVSGAPFDIKNDKRKLLDYVNNRIKALKGKTKGNF